MMKMDITYDNICLTVIRHEGVWRMATDWLWKEKNEDWITPIEMSLTDAKMGALLALMLDGEKNQEFLDEALALLTLEEENKLSKAGLIP